MCVFVYISTFGKVQLLTLAAYRVQGGARGGCAVVACVPKQLF